MKKKAAAKVKVKASKPQKKKTIVHAAKKSTASRKPVLAPLPERPKLPVKPTEDPRFTKAVQAYEQALKAMQSQKFERAKPLLEQVIGSGSKELADRAGLHLNICNQHLARTSTKFANPAEQYDYAISLMNMGDYVGAREQLEKLVQNNPKLDFAWYGYSVLECLTGHYPEALHHLSESIRLNVNNRFQARNDSDFQNLADDPRFTELLYPEGAAL